MPTKTEAKTAQANGQARDAARSVNADMDELRDDLKALRGDLSKLLSDTGSYASAKSRAGLERSKDLTQSAQKSLEDTRETVEDKVRENPLAALGIAVGVGALLSYVSSRR
ncbi:hypothetical protein AWH62_03050 [Maricaulis sp. W15]|uniref:ElaB/YqjD/DUF883 family membrane-anchored ribosome-binding protein n=1 Tax=Maricaulis maris TaxID=74318 RepID=A0A495D518_9PROT|nr:MULTISPECIES: DUF883 family protein [Maricaulis]OLF77666.1 hypothetical protein AWH62_03050 [Maricaulis sp. W15]RKQ95661.1 ElaB/YqjD/DUF883 family membrane-anchored ribosome-binding protein [Maricaulis maris]